VGARIAALPVEEGVHPLHRRGQVASWTDAFAGAYLAGHPADDPVVSPLTVDLSGLPPMLIQAATGDAFLEEAKQLAARAREHGVDARLDLYPVDTHVFHTFWSFLPEAADALQQAGRYVRDLQATLPDTEIRSESR
jgi:epsilon-lactone hydrolase